LSPVDRNGEDFEVFLGEKSYLEDEDLKIIHLDARGGNLGLAQRADL